MASDISNIVNTISSISNDKKAKISKKTPKTSGKSKNEKIDSSVLTKPIKYPLWLSVSEAAKLGGVNTKTIRRAIQDRKIAYKVINNRYLLDFSSTVTFLYSKTKLKNKINFHGIGQYIDKWRE